MTKRKNETTEQYIKRWRKEYKKLTPIYSKLINATINFNSGGFDHLLYEHGKHKRPLKVIEDRLPLIPYIPSVILNRPILLHPRIEKIEVYGRVREVIFHAFLNRINTKNGEIYIKVIVRKIGDKGSFTFQSVMKKKMRRKTKNAPI